VVFSIGVGGWRPLIMVCRRGVGFTAFRLRTAHLFAIPLLAAPTASLAINQASASAAAACVVGHGGVLNKFKDRENANSSGASQWGLPFAAPRRVRLLAPKKLIALGTF
jgi:hypothetical protein